MQCFTFVKNCNSGNIPRVLVMVEVELREKKSLKTNFQEDSLIPPKEREE